MTAFFRGEISVEYTFPSLKLHTNQHQRLQFQLGLQSLVLFMCYVNYCDPFRQRSMPSLLLTAREPTFSESKNDIHENYNDRTPKNNRAPLVELRHVPLWGLFDEPITIRRDDHRVHLHCLLPFVPRFYPIAVHLSGDIHRVMNGSLAHYHAVAKE